MKRNLCSGPATCDYSREVHGTVVVCGKAITKKNMKRGVARCASHTEEYMQKKNKKERTRKYNIRRENGVRLINKEQIECTQKEIDKNFASITAVYQKSLLKIEKQKTQIHVLQMCKRAMEEKYNLLVEKYNKIALEPLEPADIYHSCGRFELYLEEMAKEELGEFDKNALPPLEDMIKTTHNENKIKAKKEIQDDLEDIKRQLFS